VRGGTARVEFFLQEKEWLELVKKIGKESALLNDDLWWRQFYVADRCTML
jgi:hypothetical protein